MEGKTNSFKLKVELETMDTAEIKSTNALVDCGATEKFIDQHYAKSSQFCLLKLSEPIPVFNIDGTPNEGRSVTEVIDLILQYKLFLLSPTLESRSSFLDTLGSINIIQKSIGKLVKSRCLIVCLAAALVVKKTPSKNRLLVKLRSIGRDLFQWSHT